MNIKHYHRCLEIVAKEQDWKGLVLKLAKYHPDILCAIVDGIMSDLDTEIINFCNNGSRIAAIKLYRNVKDSSLKDAKEYVDNLCPCGRY